MLNYAVELCKEAEGFSPTIYKCPAGYNTIGYGRNLETNPLTKDEEALCTMYKGELHITKENAEVLLRNDLEAIYQKVKNEKWFNVDAIRQSVLLDLIFNLGLSKFKTFKKFIKAMEEKDFSLARQELENSKWYSQVGRRSIRNCALIA